MTKRAFHNCKSPDVVLRACHYSRRPDVVLRACHYSRRPDVVLRSLLVLGAKLRPPAVQPGITAEHLSLFCFYFKKQISFPLILKTLLECTEMV